MDKLPNTGGGSGLFGRISTFANQQQPATPPPPAVSQEPGTLHIRDSFMPSSPTMFETPHGMHVVKATREVGFQGNLSASVANPPKPVGFIPEVIEAHNGLGATNLSKEQALAQISKINSLEATNFLNDQAGYLESLTKGGARNSAANFSLGMSPASQATGLYTKGLATIGRSDQEPSAVDKMIGGGPKTLANLATAYDLDLKKLENNDTKISGPEHQKLQQALADHMARNMANDPSIGTARKRWDSAVQGFEANNNSVVVSAGNEGDFAEMLASGNGGLSIRQPAGFEKNILENNAVTSVGATQVNNGKEVQAGYSSVSGGVDIYANGTLQPVQGQQFPVEGTSFAAPRVAATMAQLHKDNPTLSSAQVENLLKQSLTNPMNGIGGSIRVLDQTRTQAYLGGQKF